MKRFREALRMADVELRRVPRYRLNPGCWNSRHPMKSPKAATIPLENWIGYRFSLISARLGEFVASMYAKRHDLTVPAWRSLAVIARYQPLTAKQLAARTSSDAFKVARAIDLLVRRGLIHRDVDKEDRRRVNLRLSAGGRKVYKDIEKFVVRVERELAAALDPREVAMLRQSLDKLDRQLESRIKAAGPEKFLKGKPKRLEKTVKS
jgi:DNA-binding MarR family transcriptional regulator